MGPQVVNSSLTDVRGKLTEICKKKLAFCSKTLEQNEET